MLVYKVFKENDIKPREGQVEAAEALLKALSTGSDVVFTAPTGWGKTLTVLAALKAAGRLPVLWLIRSLEVSRRVLEDAALLGLKAFAAAGRRRTCPKTRELGEAIHVWCRLNKPRCPYYLNLLRRGADAYALSWRELLEGDVCPYYAQDIPASTSDVVVQSYYRRSYPASVCVIDEAHNIVTPRERRLSVDSVEAAAAELELLGFSELNREVSALVRRSGYVRFERLPLAELEAVLIEAVAVLKKVSGLPKLIWAVRACSKGGAAYREPWEDYVSVYEPPWRPRVKPAVYVSASLPEELEPLLGAKASVRVRAEPRTAYVADWLTTKFGEETWRGYFRLLLELKKRYRRVLVFATERVMRVLAGSADLVEDRLDEIPSDWEGLLMLKTRGRYSEGVDIRADCVAVLGAPFLPPEVTSRLRRAYESLGALGGAALWVPMVVATLQCIGRAARSPRDRPVIVLADYRFERYEQFFSPYLVFEPLNI